MGKKSNELFKGKSRDEIIAGLKAMETLGRTLIRTSQNMLGNIEKSDEPEIRVVERSAIPAAYYWRDSVQEAIQAEVLRDIKAGQPVPPGFELINQEEESTNGETKEISGPEDDSTSGGDGSEPPENRENDGSKNGSSGPDNPGGAAQSPNDSGESQKTSGGE